MELYDEVREERRQQSVMARAVSGFKLREVRQCYNEWKYVNAMDAKLRRLRRVGARLMNAQLVPAFDQWMRVWQEDAASAKQRGEMKAARQLQLEISELTASLSAQSIALEEVAEVTTSMEASRRGEISKLEIEIISLDEALRKKREQHERRLVALDSRAHRRAGRPCDQA